jgi:hypothetical protein
MALAAANEYDYFCGLKDGKMLCWGSANASYFVNLYADLVAPPNLAQLAVTDSITDPLIFCGVDAAGAGTCWGPNMTTSLGTGLRAATLSRYGSCALHTDSSVTCGNEITALPSGHSYAQIVASEDIEGGIDTAGNPNFQFVTFPSGVYTEMSASGARRVAAVRADGIVVYAFGRMTPLMRTGSFVHVAVDDSGRVCALDAAGAVTCWLLSGATGDPFTNLPAGPFVSVVGAYSTFCALRASGTTACWGDTAVDVPPGW